MTGVQTCALPISRYSVIECLSKDNLINQAPAPIAYFYCTRDSAERARSDPDEILRSILKQLSFSGSNLPIREPVAETYKSRKNEAKDDGTAIEALTIEESLRLILALLKSDPATIIIASANLQKTFRSLYQLVQARKVGKVARKLQE